MGKITPEDKCDVCKESLFEKEEGFRVTAQGSFDDGVGAEDFRNGMHWSFFIRTYRDWFRGHRTKRCGPTR